LRDYDYDEKGAPLPANLCIKVCSYEDLDKTRVLSDERKKSARDAIKSGHVMVSAFLQGELAAYIWVTFQEIFIPEFNRFMRFDGAYLFDGFTFPNFRGRGLFERIIAYALKLAKQGSERAYAFVETDNIPSQKAMESSGFSRVKVAHCLKLFKWSTYAEKELP
jgi:GNAT superfamily N-acetyltransferase